MGESMSKRLKLVTGSEAEMEERSFINPFPDWDPSLPVSSDPAEHSGGNESLDADGKVRDLALLERLTLVCSMLR